MFKQNFYLENTINDTKKYSEKKTKLLYQISILVE